MKNLLIGLVEVNIGGKLKQTVGRHYKGIELDEK